MEGAIVGEALQIRVSAVTWNPDLLEKRWPKLMELAQSVPNQTGTMGVLELVTALSEGIRFMDWPEAQKKKLEPKILELSRIKRDLENALAQWKPSNANALSEQLESVLDDLEQC